MKDRTNGKLSQRPPARRILLPLRHCTIRPLQVALKACHLVLQLRDLALKALHVEVATVAHSALAKLTAVTS